MDGPLILTGLPGRITTTTFINEQQYEQIGFQISSIGGVFSQKLAPSEPEKVATYWQSHIVNRR